MSRDTYNRAKQIANELHFQGQKVTVLAVREKLGNTGSQTTINNALKDWRSEVKDKNSFNDIPEEAVSHILSMWNKLSDINDKRFLSDKEKTQNEINAIKENALSLEKEKKELLEKLSELQEHFDRQEKNNIELKKVVNKQKNDIVQLNSNIESLSEINLSKTEQLQSEKVLFEQTLASDKEQSEKTEDFLNKQIDDLRQELKVLKKSKHEEKVVLSDEISTLKEELLESKSEHSKEIAVHKNDITTFESNINTLESQLKNSTKKITVYENSITKLNNDKAKKDINIVELKGKIDSITKENKNLNAEYKRLEREYKKIVNSLVKKNGTKD